MLDDFGAPAWPLRRRQRDLRERARARPRWPNREWLVFVPIGHDSPGHRVGMQHGETLARAYDSQVLVQVDA